ncbi:MAG: sugar ABC transporter permease [Thermoprotei archaeon]|nr:MAG: sugar ABC transporter permease [Thermoprotei archaeon]
MIVFFFFIPAILTFLIGLTDMDYTLEWRWVGLKNFYQMLRDRWTPKIFNNTMFYVFTTLGFFNVGTALLISILTMHIDEKVGAAFRAIWLLPRITPSTVYALMWLWATRGEATSLFNWILGFLGIPPIEWRLQAPWLLVILVNGFVGASFGMIIFTAALKSIPVDYTRAALVDGASTFQMIRYVELPLIKWPVMFVTAYQTLSLLTSYEYILLVTDGGPGLYTTEVWALYSYHMAFQIYGGGSAQYGYGAALSAILVIIGLILSTIYWKVFRMGELMIEPKIEVD